MMKKSLLITAAMFSGILAFAQQEFQPSQYLQNLYVLNPASSGLTDYVDVNLSARQQWVGFDGAPKTYYITANSLLGRGGMGGNKMFALRVSDPYISTDNRETDIDDNTNRKLRHAIGGSFMVDIAGAFRKNTGGLTYAVHVPMTEKLNLSAGIKASINNLVFDPIKAKTLDPSDATYNAFSTSGYNTNYFDANFGLMLYSDKFYVGYSTGNLFQNDINLSDVASNSKLAMHHFISAAYRFDLGDNFGLTPATLIRLVKNSPGAVDLTAKADYQRRFWLGFSLRPQDAFVTFLGLRVTNSINLGYSYDYTTSTINKVSGGSHEIVLNLMLGK